MTGYGDGATQPLLGIYDVPQDESVFAARYRSCRQSTRAFLTTKVKHYIIMGLVALDVAAILADIFVSLISCDLGTGKNETVEKSKEILHLVGLIFSSLFLLELLLTVWAFGLGFFHEWFHCFDAFVIITSFLIDVLTHGVLEEIGSLVIILRLWRFVKIVEELSAGASERMEEIEGQIEELRQENADLKGQIQVLKDQS